MSTTESRSDRGNDLAEMDRAALEAEVTRLRGEVRRLTEERQLVIDHSSDGFWDWHIEDDFEYMSPRFWEIFGYQPEEKRHHPSAWQDLIHPEDLPRTLQTFEEHVASSGKIPYDQNVRYRHKAGHWVTVRCRGKVIEWGPDGAALRMIGTHTDMTDTIEARSRAEILYASASVGIWDWLDVNEDKEYWTPRFYALLGYEFEEIPATLENFRNFLHPDDQERTFAMVTAHFEGRGRFDLEYRLRHKSGEYRWFRGMGEAVFDAAGKPVRMVGSIQDIHDRKVAEQELKSLAHRLDLSLRASNIGVWDWDVVKNELVWDERMYRLYGIEAHEFESAYHAWLNGLHPDDKVSGDELVSEALAGRKDFDTEFRVVWPSGEVRSIHAIAAVLRDDDGNPLRMVGVNWDVTADKQRQLQLEQNAEELRRANADLEQFAYFASHDLQAPLRHITSFVKLIEEKFDGELDEETGRWMDFVTGGTSKMKRLIDDVLAYSRAGKSALVFEKTCLDNVVATVAAGINGTASSSVLKVHTENLPTVRASHSQMVQLFQNLLQNAVRYAKPNILAQVKVTAEETPTHWVVHVKDNGIGIPEEFQTVIFQPFKKALDSSETGSGIGLSICAKVVERHEGELRVASSVGEGSTFTFTLRKAIQRAE